MKNDTDFSDIYIKLGKTASFLNRLTEAENCIKMALENLETMTHPRWVAECYFVLGSVELKRRRFTHADAFYEKALDIFMELRDRRAMAWIYGELGTVAHNGNNYSLALQHYQDALRIFVDLDDKPGMARSYGRLSMLANDHFDPQQALDWAVHGVSLFTLVPHPSTGDCIHMITYITRALGLPALAAGWQRATGQPLPGPVREEVERMIKELLPG